MMNRIVLGLLLVLGILSLGVSSVALYRSRSGSVLSAAGQCEQHRLYQQVMQNPSYRERWITAGAAESARWWPNLSDEELRSRRQTEYDGNVSITASQIEFWC